MSVSGTTGWAADLQPSDASGSTQGLIIETTELDGVQYGIRCNGVQAARLGVIRVVHRYMEAGVAPADVNSAWPIVVLQIGGRQGLSTVGTTAKLFNYYKEGISPQNPLLPAGHDIHAKLGTLVDFQNDVTTNGFDLDLSTAYNTAGVTLPASKYFAGLNGNVQTGKMSVDGQTVINRVNRSAVIARAGARIGNVPTDFTLPLRFATMQLNQGNAYNTSTYAYTAQSGGLHRIRINILLNVQDGDVVRLGIRVGGVLVRETRTHSARNDTQAFALEATYPLERGDVVTFHGSSSVARAHQAGSIDISSNNYIEVYQL